MYTQVNWLFIYSNVNNTSSWLMLWHYLTHQVKMQYLHFRFHAKYFLLPRKIPEQISRRWCPFITKGSINVHSTFCYSCAFTRNLMLNGSINYVLYLQDTAFLLGGEVIKGWEYPIIHCKTDWCMLCHYSLHFYLSWAIIIHIQYFILNSIIFLKE